MLVVGDEGTEHVVVVFLNQSDVRDLMIGLKADVGQRISKTTIHNIMDREVMKHTFEYCKSWLLLRSSEPKSYQKCISIEHFDDTIAEVHVPHGGVCLVSCENGCQIKGFTVILPKNKDHSLEFSDEDDLIRFL